MLSLPTHKLPHAFAPFHPSPLSLLNTDARRHPTSTSNHKMGRDAPASSQACSAYTTASASHSTRRRESKYATLNRDGGKEREKRRGTYLDKVRRKGEDRRFETREEQALRLDFLARRREWEADQERVAEEMGVGMGEEEEEGTWRRETQTQDMDEDEFIEQFLSQEDREMEAFLSQIDDGRGSGGSGDGGGSEEAEMTEYGSDDEEYEKLLMESVLTTEQQRKAHGEAVTQEHQDMDMVLD